MNTRHVVIVPTDPAMMMLGAFECNCLDDGNVTEVVEQFQAKMDELEVEGEFEVMVFTLH